jgi:uncharacterized protein YodC (DUF2158 family)
MMIETQHERLRAGDMVQIRGGGPVMLVHSARPTLVRCYWREGVAVHFAYFRPSMIVRASAEAIAAAQ